MPKSKDLENPLDKIPVITIDLSKSLAKYSNEYGRMVHAPYGSASYEKAQYKFNLELGKIKSVIHDAENFDIDSIPNTITSRKINHMNLSEIEERLNQSVLYKDLIDRLYTVYTTIYTYFANAVVRRNDPTGFKLLQGFNILKREAYSKKERYRQLQNSYEREISELRFYVRNNSDLFSFENYRDAIASNNYELNTHTMAYLNSLLYQQLYYVCSVFLNSKEEIKQNFVKDMIRYIPGCPDPGYILNIAIDDDQNLSITKAITSYYTPEDIDMDVSKSISPNSYNTFRYLVCNGYKSFMDENVCVARAALLTSTDYENDPMEVIRLCDIKKDSLTNVSVIILNCLSSDNDAVFEYLIKNRCFCKDYLMTYNTIFSFVSDVMKYRKYRFYKTFSKYYKIEKETLIRILNEITMYSFIEMSYPSGSIDWLKSIIAKYK